MQLLIKPNWSTGTLTKIEGTFTPFQIGIGRTRFRFWSSVAFTLNSKVLIEQQGQISSRSVVRLSQTGGPLGFLIEVELLEGEYAFPNPITGIFEIDDNAILELEGTFDLKLNLRILDPKTGVKSASYTKTFEIPFTNRNSQVFTQVFHLNAEGGYNTKKKSDCLIVEGGKLVSSGYLQILEIDISNRVYKCVFFGDNANLFDDIGDNLIAGNADISKNIYFTDLYHNVTDQVVKDGWDNLLPYTYGIINDENNIFTKSILAPTGKGVEGWRWKMWFSSKELLTRIFAKYGYTFTSEFLNSETFSKHRTFPANGYTLGAPVIKWTNNSSWPVDVFSVPPQPVFFQPIQLTTEDINFFGGVSRDPITGRFIIPSKGDYRFSAIVNFGTPVTYTVPLLFSQRVDTLRFAWRIYRKGKLLTTQYGQNFNGKRQVPPGQTLLTGIANHTSIAYVWEKDTLIYPMLEAGDEIEFGLNGLVHKVYVATGLNNQGGNPFPDDQNDFASILSSRIGVDPGSLFNNIKQIDFVADIFKQFNLYIKPDKDNPRNFLIEPRNEFYKSGKTVNFLEFDSDQVEMKTGNDLWAKTYRFSYTPGDDVDNELYQKRYGDRVFGDAIINLDNDFLESERDYTLSAMPIIYSRVFDNFVLANITEGSKVGQLRYSYYTGKTEFDPPFQAKYDFPLTFGPQPLFNYYPLFSSYSDGLGEGSSLLFASSRNKTVKEQSLYYEHWENEIETYADPSSHILSLRVKLNSNILASIDFNDVYWLEVNGQGRYYTLLEIKEFDPSDTELVQMDFLTYLDYRAPRPKRGRPNWAGDGADKVGGNPSLGDDIILSPLFPDRDWDWVDDSWGDTPNSPVNGKDARGSGNIFLGDAKYPTLIGDGIIVEPGVEMPFINGTDIVVGVTASNSFIWNATDVNVEATVVSWGASGATHSISDSFLFNNFNPVLAPKDQTAIPVAEDGTMVWNEVEEVLYVSKSNVWLPVGGGGNTDYINIFDFSSGSTTTFTLSDQWEVLNMSSTTGFSQGDLSADGSGLITYSGSSARRFRIDGVASGSSGANNEIHFAFFKNGLLWPCSEQSSIAGVGGRANTTPFQCVVELEAGDTIQVYVKNSSGTASFTLQNVNVIVERI